MSREACPRVLDRYPGACRPVGAVESLGNAGGTSGSRLWRFASARGRLGLRAWPVDGPSLVGLARIHGWITDAGSLPFVPVPIVASDGRTVQECDGRLWDLAPWMPGVADGSRPPSPARIRAAFQGLAAFHARFRPGGRAISAGLFARSRDVERWMGGDFAALRARLLPVGADPRSDLVRAWLGRAERESPTLVGRLRGAARPVPIQPCLRDARPDHFLFEGDRLSGLVDFGAMGSDTVAGDLARLLGEAIGPDQAARGLAMDAYRSVRPIADDEARLIPVFEAANAVLGAGRWARWHFLEGREFEDPDAVVAGLRRCLRRMDEETESQGPIRS